MGRQLCNSAWRPGHNPLVDSVFLPIQLRSAYDFFAPQFWYAPALQAPDRATPSKSTDGHHAATPNPRAGLPAVRWKSNPVAFTKSGSVFCMLPLIVRPEPPVSIAFVDRFPTSVPPLDPSNHTPAVVGS